LPDRYLDHDKPEKMYAAAGLDAKSVVETALDLLGRDHAASPIRA
jgi:1-deoxy-D-xylulose-5-phosphate synthase